MEIQFYGAAQNVTGSQHLLRVNGKRILLDCGMFQGKRKESYEKNRKFLYDPASIDVMLLSHAHIDHSGNIPNLVKHGFKGHIYATSATVDLCQIMLRDSAFLQEKDVKFVNKKRAKQGKALFEPLYDIDDVELAAKSFVGVQYDKQIEVFPGIKAIFRDAGHILGSSGIQLDINENGRKISLGFTGDIGRNDMPILRNPDVLRDVNVMIMESTYGNRLHDISGAVEDEFALTLNEVIKRRGKIIVPAFAVGRTQLLVYVLHKLWEQNRIPEFPIFVDSPLAVRTTDVFRNHPECFDRETYSLFLKDKEDPFGFGKLKYINDVEESKKLNDMPGPYMVISASGMAEAGRILHHLKNNIEDSNNLILFVGYAAQETLARKIMDGNPQVNIFGEPYNVKAQIKKMDYFSAHADQKELLDYLSYSSKDVLKKIFLVHGEEDQALPLKEAILKKGFNEVYYPAENEKYTI
ncbi:MAG TPA: MBL fold metallo-hydrolase [Ignavibacteriaceae bacterium]|nr:MBL fold metallo-hydrolase [Ignavibacteriaceae bacterium]